MSLSLNFLIWEVGPWPLPGGAGTEPLAEALVGV